MEAIAIGDCKNMSCGAPHPLLKAEELPPVELSTGAWFGAFTLYDEERIRGCGVREGGVVVN